MPCSVHWIKERRFGKTDLKRANSGVVAARLPRGLSHGYVPPSCGLDTGRAGYDADVPDCVYGRTGARLESTLREGGGAFGRVASSAARRRPPLLPARMSVKPCEGGSS